MDDVYVYLINMPPHVHEFVTPCCDGYTVYIDKKLSADKRTQAYNHALGHIQHNDFSKILVGEIEVIAHER